MNNKELNYNSKSSNRTIRQSDGLSNEDINSNWIRFKANLTCIKNPVSYYQEFKIAYDKYQKSWNNLIHRSFRVCARCGHHRVQDLFFCAVCEKSFLDSAELKSEKIWEEKSKLTYLFEWEQDMHPMLNYFLILLKGGLYPEAFASIVEHFLYLQPELKNFSISSERNKYVIVPSPGRFEFTEDHASVLAKAFADKLNITLIKPLHRQIEARKSAQKQKSKQERMEAMMTLDEKFTQQELSCKRIIFVDDIYTTGATAHAAYLALGKPKQFEVWTIARRNISF